MRVANMSPLLGRYHWLVFNQKIHTESHVTMDNNMKYDIVFAERDRPVSVTRNHFTFSLNHHCSVPRYFSDYYNIMYVYEIII